jgi:hypothetical protein
MERAQKLKLVLAGHKYSKKIKKTSMSQPWIYSDDEDEVEEVDQMNDQRRSQYLKLAKNIQPERMSPQLSNTEILARMLRQNLELMSSPALHNIVRYFNHEIQRSDIITLYNLLRRQTRSDYRNRKRQVINAELHEVQLWLQRNDQYSREMRAYSNDYDLSIPNHRIEIDDDIPDRPMTTTISTIVSTTAPIIPVMIDNITLTTIESTTTSSAPASTLLTNLLSPLITHGPGIDVIKILQYVRQHGKKPHRWEVLLTNGMTAYLIFTELESTKSGIRLWKEYQKNELPKIRQDKLAKRKIATNTGLEIKRRMTLC